MKLVDTVAGESMLSGIRGFIFKPFLHTDSLFRDLFGLSWKKKNKNHNSFIEI